MNAKHATRRLASGLALGLLSLMPAGAAADDTPALTGTWTWDWKDGQGATHRHVLEVEGAGETLSARERFDDLDPVKVEGLKVEGKKVNFSVQRGERRATYSGTIADDKTINGNVVVLVGNQSNEFTWTARRLPPGKE